MGYDTAVRDWGFAGSYQVGDACIGATNFYGLWRVAGVSAFRG